MIDRQRRIAATHEAGHLTCSLALRHHVVGARIYDGGAGACRERSPPGLDPRELARRRAIIDLCGAYACRRRFGLAGLSGSEVDFLAARSRIAEHALDEAEIRATAERIVVNNWRAVDLFARALYRAGQLDRKQIIALLLRGHLARPRRRAA